MGISGAWPPMGGAGQGGPHLRLAAAPNTSLAKGIRPTSWTWISDRANVKFGCGAAFIQVDGKASRNRRKRSDEDVASALRESGRRLKLLGASPPVYAGYSWTSTRVASPPSVTTVEDEDSVKDLLSPAPRENQGGKFNKAWKVASDPDSLALALEKLKRDFFAESNAAPRARKQQDVLALADAVAGGRDPFPLGVSTVLKFAAALKEAGFKSGTQNTSEPFESLTSSGTMSLGRRSSAPLTWRSGPWREAGGPVVGHRRSSWATSRRRARTSGQGSSCFQS